MVHSVFVGWRKYDRYQKVIDVRKILSQRSKDGMTTQYSTVEIVESKTVQTSSQNSFLTEDKL